MGIFYGMTVLPAFHVNFNLKKLFIMILGIGCLITVFTTAAVLLVAEKSVAEWCTFCSYVDCVDFGVGWCSDEAITRLFGL